jgi:hypothetical protein
MKEPPVLVDGARVISYCSFGPETRPTGRRRIFVGEQQLDLTQVRAVIIGENLADGDLMLMHCGANWEALASFYCESTTAAEASASAAYTGAPFCWERFRELTAAELVEVESAHAEMKAWAREYHEHPEDEA